MIWGTETLKNRSVTGVATKKKKDALPKPPLSPSKLKIVRGKTNASFFFKMYISNVWQTLLWTSCKNVLVKVNSLALRRGQNERLLIWCGLITHTRSFPRVSLRQSVSRDSRQCRDNAEIVQSEQIHLWKDNGHQQVHQEWGAAGVQAAHQTDSQDGELHLRWHIVINCHASAFCPAWSAGYWGDLIWVVGGCCNHFRSGRITLAHRIGCYLKC